MVKVKNILAQTKEDVANGKITLHQAGLRLYLANWFNFEPDENMVTNLINNYKG